MLPGMPTTFISRPVLRGVAAIPLLFVILISCAGSGAEPPLADCSQNAAIYYWKAAALIQAPTTREELEYARKADILLADVSPAIFAAQPEMLQWLLNTGPMLPALRQARACAICEFPIRTGSEPFLDLSHLPRLRALTRRALAAAKAYEFVDNAPGAAAIYVDLLKLVQHLDQDRNLISGFVAAELLQRDLSDLESFFGRNPSAEALAPLMDYFNRLPPLVFHPGDYLRDEARRYGDWLLESAGRPEERLSRLYRNAKSKPAIEKLMTLDPQTKQQRLKGWVDDYRQQMDALAAAVDLPFAPGLTRIRQLDEQRESVQADASAPGDNPLVPLLVPTATEMFQRFLLAEAQFDMLHILCAAAAYRAKTGSWPGDMNTISRYTQQVMPKDPFSGDKFYYKLEHGMPVLITRVPKRMMSREQYSYFLGIDQRRKTDIERTMNAVRDTREFRKPVPIE
jgi:hypothetical protein